MSTSSQGASGPDARTGLYSGPLQVSGKHTAREPALTRLGQASSEPRNGQIKNLIVRLLTGHFGLRIDEIPGDIRPPLKRF
jgi:hypothetical protein